MRTEEKAAAVGRLRFIVQVQEEYCWNICTYMY
jgi:hypothetical protein